MDDTQKELERLDRELAALEKAEQERNAPPAAPEAEINHQPKVRPAAAQAQQLPSEQDNKTVITLMILASVLCLGIIGVLIYWLEAFLK